MQTFQPQKEHRRQKRNFFSETILKKVKPADEWRADRQGSDGGGGGREGGSLPGRQAFQACEATAAERVGGGGGGDKTMYEKCGCGYEWKKEGKKEKCQNGKLKNKKKKQLKSSGNVSLKLLVLSC